MRIMRLRLVLGISIACVLIVPVSAIPGHAAEPIVLVGSQDTKNSFHGRWLTLIYTEVFKRLGYDLQYHGYPSARASRMSDAGLFDGEINRVAAYQAAHPNLIRLETSHFTTTLAAYAVKPGIQLEGWESFKDTDYLVEYRRGTKIVEVGLTPFVLPGNLSEITTTEQGLKRLILDRTDIYVDVVDTVTGVLKELNSDKYDPSSVYQAGIMAKTTLHLYLHKKHAALVPKVNETLKAIKKEGLVAQYQQRAKNP